jgi:hypothetical protein
MSCRAPAQELLLLLHVIQLLLQQCQLRLHVSIIIC